MQAQDLEKHQWKNRIIAISSPEFNDRYAEDQLRLLQGNLNALQERKLIIYHVTNHGFTKDFSSEIFPSENTQTEITSFHISLIGLDGTEKMAADSPRTAKQFFDLIDQMPMRQEEMKE